jgi:hypothetical protein
MSVFKPFITSDVIVSPFKVNKSFTFTGLAAVTGSGIDIFIGFNQTSNPWVSGSDNTGYNSIQSQYLIYKSVKELYYSNFISGSNGSPANTASFNPDGTITGPIYQPSYYNYLTNTLPANRYFPTQSQADISMYSIPSNLFGEYIQPGSLTIYLQNSFKITDDGEGILNVSGSISGEGYIGNIIYEHGMVILTSPNFISPEFDNVSDFTTNTVNMSMSFQSTLTVFESQYKCTIRENEFNFSQNPSLISGSSNSGIISSFATGSYFDPYITTVGLYNNNKELLAVAKLAQPLPVSSITDTNIMVNLDL